MVVELLKTSVPLRSMGQFRKIINYVKVSLFFYLTFDSPSMAACIASLQLSVDSKYVCKILLYSIYIYIEIKEWMKVIQRLAHGTNKKHKCNGEDLGISVSLNQV